MRVDKRTKFWTRNAADEKAVRNGCRMDEERGQFVVDWARDNLVLWEGDAAGQPLIATDWQFDCTMRLFGWVRPSERWGRLVRRFREALIGKPKKNKKSPTVAWWMLYLLDGDGEPGQNCYSAAKNGDQAKIVQNHAIKMVRASPTLSRYMKINKSTSQITVEETNSTMKVLSSENVQTQKAKEGLNGSVAIDEIHVVDAAFARRISRMGISRSEPLMIQVTTAGNDPLSYGKARYDYGQRVNRGDFDNEAFFFDWHEAPQDLSFDDLAKDPVKWGKLANPSWGHTVGEEEYVADYSSCDTQSALRDFMMYRLNIWQTSSSPWLDQHAWNDCETDVPDDVLQAVPCWGGLDLSRTRDLTSLALCFDLGETKHFRWWFWVPHARAKELAALVPFSDWATDPRCNLTISEGDWIDYDCVWSTIIEVSEKYRMQKLMYDQRFADYLIQRIQEGEQNTDGTWKHRPAEFEIVKCGQTAVTLCEPIEEFEKLVISKTLSHNGDPVAKWQAGNVTLARNGLIRKPGADDDPRTIDGIQAGVMALAGSETGEFSQAYSSSGSGVVLF